MDEGLFDAPGSAARTGGGSLNANTHASAPLAVRMRPRTLDELGRIQGVGAAKLERYGEAMLAAVAAEEETADGAAA